MRRTPVQWSWTVGLLLLPIVSVPALSQQTQVVMEQPTVVVSGMGDVEVAPDLAEISLAVDTQEPTARAAGDANARLMERVIQALVQAGVPREDIETRGYTIFPEYIHRPDAEPQIRGYRATNLVVVKTTELDRVGALIDTALTAGANRVDGVSFSLRDPAAAQAVALKEAVERARRSAEAIAEALGVRLGRVMQASSISDPVRPVPIMAMGMRKERMEMADAGGAEPPIQPGRQTVTAMVTVVYQIEGSR